MNKNKMYFDKIVAYAGKFRTQIGQQKSRFRIKAALMCVFVRPTGLEPVTFTMSR